MSDLFIIKHPLVQSKLALLRDKNTNNKEFRELVSEVSGLLAYEATRDMEVKTENIETPFAPAEAKTMDKEIGLVPILRAGIGMVDGIVNLFQMQELVTLVFTEILILLCLLNITVNFQNILIILKCSFLNL